MGMAAENAMAFGVNEALKRAFPDDPTETNKMNDGPPNLGKPFLMVRTVRESSGGTKNQPTKNE